jgi:hypothetical protein
MLSRSKRRLRITAAILLALLTLVGVKTGRATLFPQKYSDLKTKTPIPEGETLIIGFLGGWEKFDDPNRGVRKFALRLRAMNLPGVHVETVENHSRSVALQLVKDAFDRNPDGKLTEDETRNARLILYGQSFGGAAVNKLSKELEPLGVPVLLSIQIDSVGSGDGDVPANVRRAVNFYQKNDHFGIRGEDDFRAADPQKTEILGNYKFDYSNKKVDLTGAHWYQKLFKNAHVKMELDPEVWFAVEKLILAELETGSKEISR